MGQCQIVRFEAFDSYVLAINIVPSIHELCEPFDVVFVSVHILSSAVSGILNSL